LARREAIEHLGGFPRLGGTLLLICRGREPGDSEGQMPWPLLREELNALDGLGLRPVQFEDYLDRHDDPAVRRFRVLYAQNENRSLNP
jgi:hypothetical protein